MRNIRIEEVMNGWKVFIKKDTPIIPLTATQIQLGYSSYTEEEYVFTDWSEMMEFIEDYFAEEGE